MAASLGLLMTGGSKAYSSQSRQPRPNILLIMTDQQTADAMSCAGNPYLNTPAMNSLAETGIRFENTYCSNPICIPSRVGLFNGRYPHEMGVYFNLNPKGEVKNFPMLGKQVKMAGYDTGYVGKWHLLADKNDKAVHGFDFMDSVRDNDVDFDIPKGCEKFLSTKRTNPFFLVASFVNPHDVCEWAREQSLRNGNIGEPPVTDLCPPLLENHQPPDIEPSIIRQIQQKYKKLYPTADWPSGKWRQYRWAYYRMVELVDKHIGELLQTLKKTGNYKNTVIIFTSDHGDGVGAHKWNQKQMLYDETARVPMIISHSGSSPAGVVDKNRLVSTLDIFPTICDYAGAKLPGNLRGQSLKNVAEGRNCTPLRKYVVTETELTDFNKTPLYQHTGPEGRMVRSSDFKYVVYSQGSQNEQLFDMNKDPGEMRNLAYRTEYKDVLEQHKKFLKDWSKRTNDDFKQNN